MYTKHSIVLWIIGIEILIFWSGDILIMGHCHHGRHHNEDSDDTSISRLQSNTNGSRKKEILRDEQSGSTSLQIPLRIGQGMYSRQRRNLNHNNDLPEVALSLMSFHQVGAHLRVLYVYGEVVAGKPIKDLESGRRMTKIGKF